MRISNAVPYINDAKNTDHVNENKSIRMRSMNDVLLDRRSKRTAHVRVATAFSDRGSIRLSNDSRARTLESFTSILGPIPII